MNPLMMDPLHVHASGNFGLVGPNSYQQQFGSQPNNSFGNPSHMNHGYHDEPRQLTAVLQKTDPHSDAHVSGDDFERSCVIYVAGLNTNLDEGTFFDTFRQFGNIQSCVRRAVDFEMKPSGQQYAFIRYSSPEEARFAIGVGEVEVQGRKLIIKPRDKKGSRLQRQNSHGSSEHRQSFGTRGSDHILKMISNKNHQGHRSERKADGKEDLGPPLLLSKSLTASNLPDDMGPKQLYHLFSEVGPVEGCYVFPMCDHAGRRYGHVVMNSFYYAQKAVELLHGIHVQGYVLDVAYKSPLSEDTEPAQTQPPAPPPGLPVGPPQLAHMFMPSPPPPPPPPPQVQSQLFVQHQPQPPIGWLQQGMGNASSRPFISMPQPYGVQAPQMMPAFNGQGPIFNQPAMDYPRYNSPPLMSTPSPPQAMRWSSTPPEQKLHFNGRQLRRAGPPPGLGASANRHPEFSAGSSSDDQSRSASHCTDTSATLSSSPPLSEGTRKQITEDMSTEQGKEQEDTSDALAVPATPTFEILSPPVIPEAKKPTDPCNLFIKNLDDSAISTPEELQKHFETYGQVASAHLATYNDSKISRGYGFVAFAKAEDAALAKEKLNNTLIGRKRVFVSYAERKEDRAKRLKSIFQGTKLEDEDEEKDSKGTKEGDPNEAKEKGTKWAKSSNEPKDMSKKEKHLSASTSTEESPDVLSSEVGLRKLVVVSKAMKELSVLDGDKRSKATILASGPISQDQCAPKTDSQDENKVNTALVDQRIPMAPIVGSVKGWRGTQLPGIAEVEEEKVATPNHPVGKLATTATPTKHVDPTSTEVSVGQQPQNKVSSPSDGKDNEGANKAGAINKRSSRRGPGTQKVSGGQIQAAVPNFRNANSVGRASSRIPVQNKGGATMTAGSTPPTGLRVSAEATATGQNQSKRRGYKGSNNRNARSSNTENSGGTADGGTASSPPQKSSSEQQKADKVGITMAAH